ncbi:MAG: penicillin acylase family protein [Bdellovibrionota bacterium]
MKNPRFYILLGAAIAVVLAAGIGSAGLPPALVDKVGDFGQISIRVNKAENPDEALFERQGYLAAKDRFIQMDLTRRVAGATLAEVFGENALPRDRTILSTGIPAAAEKTFKRLQKKAPHALKALDAYARGINAFLRELPQTHPQVLRFYRVQTRDSKYLPAEWTALDSLAIATGLEFFASSSLEQKLIFGAIFYRVLGANAERFHEFFDMRTIEQEFILGKPARSARKPASVRTAKVGPLKLDYKWQDMGYPFPGPGFTAGSNSWVVSKKFSGGNTTFLANDPHLPLFYPSTFQEIALDSTPAGGSFRVRGMSIPGIPGVFIGANDKITWGITNLLADVDDVYIETMSTDGKRVKFLGREVPIEKTRYFRKVRQKDGSLGTQKIVVRWVPHHGPVVSDHLPGVLLPPGVILSYRWTGHEGSTGVAGLLDLNRAKDFDSFKTALTQWESGPHNFIYADLNDNIGYYAFGRYPKRPDPTRVVAPYLPVSGMGTYEWEGYQETMPELYNPKNGKIVTANNDPYGRNATEQLGDFENYFGYRFAPGARAKRISDLLNQNKGRITGEVLKKIQFDHKDLIAVRVLDMFRTIAQQRHTASTELNKNEILKTLLRWDAVADRNRKEPVYFYTWLSTLMEMYYSRLGVKDWLSNFTISHAAVTSMYHGMQKAQKNNLSW